MAETLPHCVAAVWRDCVSGGPAVLLLPVLPPVKSCSHATHNGNGNPQASD